MSEIEDIRNLYFSRGKNISEIGRETGYDRKTISKYLSKEDWLIKEPVLTEIRGSKLDKYKPDIDSWLEEDKRMRKKQRHTAKRVYNRLKDKYKYTDFNISYRTVVTYVTAKKKELYDINKSYLPLQHKPGEAQIDFGKAEFIEKGKRFFGSYLSLSFPYSNAGFLQLFKGENYECLSHGLKNIYEHIGGVPHRQWFDNLSSVVIDIKKGKDRLLRDIFIRFKEHYGFEAVFCNPASGHEKGNVENKVGYLRRNLLVPMPEFSDLDEYNRNLLIACDEDIKRKHYRKEDDIDKLFEEDLRQLNPLPEKAFEDVTYEKVRTDGFGKFTIDNGKHTYSTSPRLAAGTVTIAKTYKEIGVLDNKMNEVVVHERLYGEERQESMNWLPYLNQLSRKPAALKYTGIYNMFPEPVKKWFDNTSQYNKSKALKLFAKMSEESGFEVAVKSLESVLSYGVSDFESLFSIYRNIINKVIELTPIKTLPGIPNLSKVESDVTKYDRMFLDKGGRDVNH